MSKFKKEIDKELSFLKATDDVHDIITKAKRKSNIITRQKAVAIAAAIVLIFTVIFIPTNGDKNGFAIIANAQATSDSASPDNKKATGDELTSDNFVELKSDQPNYIYYNFNYILDENADDTDLVRKYLFHSFDKFLKIRVEGDDIDTITYKINNGSLTSYTTKIIDEYTTEYRINNTTGGTQSQITIDYEKQSNTGFSLNPVSSTFDRYNYDNEMLDVLKDTGEIVSDTAEVEYSEDGEIIEYSEKEIIGSGYRDNETLVTNKEITKLKEYLKKDDMVGFHNYQNKIFKRIIEEMTLDIIITKNNGDKETKKLEFLYTPEPFRSSQLDYYDTTQSTTMSAGTLSAKIKD